MIELILGAIALWFLYHQIVWYTTQPNFEGKVVLITGASSGIGEEITKQLSKYGAKKLILCSRRIPELERVKRECIEAGTKSEITVM